MKNVALIGSLLLLLFSACEENLDITTTTDTNESESILLTPIVVSGKVIGYPDDLGKYGFSNIHNANVQLIYDGEILDETNPDGSGYYDFSAQIVPEGTYILISAPGFYPNARKVDNTLLINYFNLVPTYHADFSGSGLTDNLDVVRIRGSLQADSGEASNLFYFVNEDNKLIGNFISDAVLEFDITTIADTEIFFYHQTRPNCPLYGPISLGAFSEDTDLGNVYEENNDAFKSKVVSVHGKATSCDNMPLFSDGYYLVKFGDVTISHIGDRITSGESDRLFHATKCELESAPEILITAVNNAESTFGERTLTYSGEEYIENIDISTCTFDDTFLSFTINGISASYNNFTTANSTPDGRLVVKQIAVSANGADGNVSFELLSDGTLGTYEAKFVVYLNSSVIGVISETQNLMVEITSNDGEYLAGTFSGELFDAYELSLGNLTGDFKARIQ